LNKRDVQRKKNEDFLLVRVTGGLGSYFGGSSRIFWVHLVRPLDRDVVKKCLEEAFKENLEKVSTPLTSMSLSYAFRVRRPISVKRAWGLCVNTLAEICRNGNKKQTKKVS
jgi:hypothetical protein